METKPNRYLSFEGLKDGMASSYPIDSLEKSDLTNKFAVINVTTNPDIKTPIEENDYEPEIKTIDEKDKNNYSYVNKEEYYSVPKEKKIEYKKDGNNFSKELQKYYSKKTNIGTKRNSDKLFNDIIKSHMDKGFEPKNQTSENNNTISAEDLELDNRVKNILDFWEKTLRETTGDKRKKERNDRDLENFLADKYNWTKMAITNSLRKNESDLSAANIAKNKELIKKFEAKILANTKNLDDINKIIENDKINEELIKIHKDSILTIAKDSGNSIYKITKVEGGEVFYENIKTKEGGHMTLKNMRELLYNPKNKILDVNINYHNEKEDIKNIKTEEDEVQEILEPNDKPEKEKTIEELEFEKVSKELEKLREELEIMEIKAGELEKELKNEMGGLKEKIYGKQESIDEIKKYFDKFQKEIGLYVSEVHFREGVFIVTGNYMGNKINLLVANTNEGIELALIKQAENKLQGSKDISIELEKSLDNLIPNIKKSLERELNKSIKLINVIDGKLVITFNNN